MSVFHTYNKDKHLQRALNLLESENSVEHVYACLELRFCIEAIVYQKLLHGVGCLPNTIVNTWQPTKALKMLVEFDKLSASDCVVEVNLSHSTKPPESGWLSLGQQKLPPVRWLTTTYNKLGNFLHLVEPQKAVETTYRDIQKDLRDIAEQLKQYVSSNILISYKNIDIKQCPACQQDMAFSLKNVRDGETRKCSNFRCGALFTVKADIEKQEIKLSCNTYDVKCQLCDKDIVIPEEVIRNLDIFSCHHCCAEYIPRGKYEFALLRKQS
ncbi:hypothetical protein L6J37_21120 [Photobacterium sp. WH77]|uniref:hypothetical protein n=1 Tax=unclassified Photobacterium TaxID=2628852 RepID=UPI001EDBB280|nr:MULTISPECIES: hypothetical protein [unclassified Photobacterium]MCG2839332.1 hypothetical protein [Photobacterium sp. WH77]MCG2846949.1 hypothetical protein [Photobacterium sp. WH80]